LRIARRLYQLSMIVNFSNAGGVVRPLELRNLKNRERKKVFKVMAVNRVENWKKFSQHVEEYTQERTVDKYGIENSTL